MKKKKKKFELLDTYAKDYKATCDTHKDTLFFVKKALNLYEEKNKIWDILSEITDSIQKKKLIDIPSLQKKYGEIKLSFIDTISAYNDSLMKEANSDEEYSYKDLITELNEGKTEIQRLNNLIDKLNSENEKLIQRNTYLEGENNQLLEDKEKIRAIVNR